MTDYLITVWIRIEEAFQKAKNDYGESASKRDSSLDVLDSSVQVYMKGCL